MATKSPESKRRKALVKAALLHHGLLQKAYDRGYAEGRKDGTLAVLFGEGAAKNRKAR